MAFSIVSDSATIGTTEYSLPNDSTTLTPQTDDCILEVFIDFAAMTVTEEYQVKIYETVVTTQRLVSVVNFVGAQSLLFVSPSLIMATGWDVTVKKIAGTDRSIVWSIRKIT